MTLSLSHCQSTPLPKSITSQPLSTPMGSVQLIYEHPSSQQVYDMSIVLTNETRIEAKHDTEEVDWVFRVQRKKQALSIFPKVNRPVYAFGYKFYRKAGTDAFQLPQILIVERSPWGESPIKLKPGYYVSYRDHNQIDFTLTAMVVDEDRVQFKIQKKGSDKSTSIQLAPNGRQIIASNDALFPVGSVFPLFFPGAAKHPANIRLYPLEHAVKNAPVDYEYIEDAAVFDTDSGPIPVYRYRANGSFWNEEMWYDQQLGFFVGHQFAMDTTEGVVKRALIVTETNIPYHAISKIDEDIKN